MEMLLLLALYRSSNTCCEWDQISSDLSDICSSICEQALPLYIELRDGGYSATKMPRDGLRNAAEVSSRAVSAICVDITHSRCDSNHGVPLQAKFHCRRCFAASGSLAALSYHSQLRQRLAPQMDEAMSKYPPKLPRMSKIFDYRKQATSV